MGLAAVGGMTVGGLTALWPLAAMGRPSGGAGLNSARLCDHSHLLRTSSTPSRHRARRNGENVSWCNRRIEAHVVGLTPPVGLAGQLIANDKLRPIVHAKCRHVKPDGCLSRLVWIKVHDGQHGVRVRLAALGEADHLRPIDVMEP